VSAVRVTWLPTLPWAATPQFLAVAAAGRAAHALKLAGLTSGHDGTLVTAAKALAFAQVRLQDEARAACAVVRS
jgi:hypothetical protein